MISFNKNDWVETLCPEEIQTFELYSFCVIYDIIVQEDSYLVSYDSRNENGPPKSSSDCKNAEHIDGTYWYKNVYSDTNQAVCYPSYELETTSNPYDSDEDISMATDNISTEGTLVWTGHYISNFINSSYASSCSTYMDNGGIDDDVYGTSGDSFFA
jgi:hypothetical protein